LVKLTVSDPLVVLVPEVTEVMVGESTWLVSAWGPTWADEARYPGDAFAVTVT
jgi:hypothetical protein